MTYPMNIGIIGCGHMGSAVAHALLAKKTGGIWASNHRRPHFKPRQQEKKHFHWTKDNALVVSHVDIVVIAVKPNGVQEVLREIKPALRKNQLLVSIAAGVPLAKLKRWSGGHKIVRAMPNLPAQVLDGISTWKSLGLTKSEKKRAQQLLTTFGKEIEVQDEKLIDIATAIGGGGPAYTAAFLECMANVALKIGFSEKDALKLAIETVNGTLDYIKETGISLRKLKNSVQTKGGTTEAGFKILKQKKWQTIFEKALLAGYKRACELGH